MRLLPKREMIGPPDCPILYRWTFLRWGRMETPETCRSEYGLRAWRYKAMFHRFLPGADDRALHDHPRPFLTLVLRGGYEDLVPCRCVTPGATRDGGPWLNCPRCDGAGLVVGDRMRPGSLRYRPARHVHRTRVDPGGCWTLVLMGPLERQWGFWEKGPWGDHEETFGFGMRCESADDAGTSA